MPSSWSEAAAAAICKEWGGTREQTPKAPKPAINRNQELVGFSLSMSSKSYDSLVMRTCKWAPLSSSPSLYKGLCHGTGDADIRERKIEWTAAGPGAGKNRRKAFPLCSLDQVESIPIRQGWLHLSSINHTD